MKQYGGVDILVSNAAANPFFGPMLDVSESRTTSIFQDFFWGGWGSEDFFLYISAVYLVVSFLGD